MQTSHGATEFIDRPGGRVAYAVHGSGPLVLCVPGMGDSRGVYADVVEYLTAAGYRVVTTDVRGQGDSDAGFGPQGDTATAGDLLALIDRLGEPAVLVGNSFGGSASVIAAAQRPDAVAGLVLISPFLRETSSPAQLRLGRLLFRVMFSRPWGAAAWLAYYSGPLVRGARPAGLVRHIAELRASFRDPARLRALRGLILQLDHREVEPAVASVRSPALVLVGALDPDYRDPAAELAEMGSALRAETELIPDAAHYAQLQRPEVVAPRILAFLAGLGRDGERWSTRA